MNDYLTSLTLARQAPRLNWQQALAAMKAGKTIRRASQMQFEVRGGIVESGECAMALAVAVTENDEIVNVFVNRLSRSHVLLIEPQREHTTATDWVVIQDERLI
jgi:hypothetical protein